MSYVCSREGQGVVLMGLSKPDQPFGFLLEDTMLDTNALH